MSINISWRSVHMDNDTGIRNEIIEGRNAVIEALRAGRAIDKLYISRGEVD